MKIYTKTGDGGDTGIMGGGRLSKSDPRIVAIGEVDELNATIGLCRAEGDLRDIEPILHSVQNLLFDLGSELASPGDERFVMPDTGIVGKLEAEIDRMTAELPELHNFILPGGSELAARIHVARAVCRRAERALIQLSSHADVRAESKMFLNRLADYLFVAARTANCIRNVKDVNWTRGS